MNDRDQPHTITRAAILQQVGDERGRSSTDPITVGVDIIDRICQVRSHNSRRDALIVSTWMCARQEQMAATAAERIIHHPHRYGLSLEGVLSSR